MRVVIYHNPDCGTSRNVLGVLRTVGAEIEIIEYLKTPPARDTLISLMSRMGMAPHDLVRERGTPYGEFHLDRASVSDDELIDAMLRHPILINRPIVVTDDGAKLCRPSDLAFDLVGQGVTARLRKEDGAPFLRDAPEPEDSEALKAALAAASLPTTDLADPGRSFFRYAALDGETVGFAGYELYGRDALVRSIVVDRRVRGEGLGRNIMPLLLRRAYDAGARQAYALTTSAKRFLEQLGFAEVTRASAPAAILATRQAASLCSASAPLLTCRLAL